MAQANATQAQVVQATLLYDTPVSLPAEKVRAELRSLAGRRNLSTAGETDYRDGVLRFLADPFRITIEMGDTPLPASDFCGALSAHLNGSLRRPLAAVIADHEAHIRISVADIRRSQGHSRDMRKPMIFAQDVLRVLMKLMPPMALHWQPSNMLTLPMGLAGSAECTLFLPLCLRMRNTSSVIGTSPQVNFAQVIEGAEVLIGRPLHVMSTSLDRFETMDLVTAFIGQIVLGEGGAVPGTVFRDKKGTRVEVVDHKPCEDAPEGLLALVELEQMEHPQPGDGISRDVVAARVDAVRKARSRDLELGPKRPAATLNDAQAQVLRRSVDRMDAAEAAAKEAPLPSGHALRTLRFRAASQPRNTRD